MRGEKVPEMYKKESKKYRDTIIEINKLLKEKGLNMQNAIINDFTDKELDLFKKVRKYSDLEINKHFTEKEAKNEHKILIRKWESGEIDTDELEKQFEELNKKYRTNYKVSWRREEYI